MKSFVMYLSCFLIALTLTLPTARIIYTIKNTPTETVCVKEEARQTIYAPQQIIKYAENKHTIRNPYEQQASEICEKLSEACAKAGVGMRAFSKSFMQLCNVMQAFHKAELAGYKYTHPRVVHLAYHSRKFRVRKKNRNRIRRMK